MAKTKSRYTLVRVIEHPYTTISYGGGMGGCNVQYCMCTDIDLDGQIISLRGFRGVHSSPQDHNVLDENTWTIISFNTSCWPEARVDRLLECLERGDMQGALSEYRVGNSTNQPSIIKRQRVTACGNWHLVEPTP